MTVQATNVMLGIDLQLSEAFYGEGLGCKLDKAFPNFVQFDLGDGSSFFALFEWDAAVQDASVPSQGSGVRGVSLHFVGPSSEAVDEVIANATNAGGEVVKPAQAAEWGGYFGYFSDPDGYLWKVASS
jgi:hypothetical protein